MSATQVKLNGMYTALGFALGAINVLILYPRVFSQETYGIISFVLASATLLFPLISLGMQQTVLKFYDGRDATKRHQTINGSLQLMSLFALLSMIGVLAFGDRIAESLSKQNKVEVETVYILTVLGVLMAYFELFFAFSKVQFKTSLGVFLKEVFPRLGVLLLLCSHFTLFQLSLNTFLFFAGLIYLARALFMGIMAFKRTPFTLLSSAPITSYFRLLTYSGLVLLGSVLSMAFIEIDKVMLHLYSSSSEVALYTVFVFMATTVAIPMRAIQPLYNAQCAAFQLQEKKEALTLLVQQAISMSSHFGVLIVGILLAASPVLHFFLPEDYHEAFRIFPVLLFLKFIDSSFSPINSLFYYSGHYKAYLGYSLGFLFAMIVLNVFLIPRYGMIGAAWATTIAVVLFAVIKVMLSASLLGVLTLHRDHWLPLLYLALILGIALLVPERFASAAHLAFVLFMAFSFWKRKVFSGRFLEDS